MAEKLDVKGGIFVTVVMCPTFGANPIPFGQPQVLVNVTANVTAFTRREETVNLVKVRSIPLALVSQLTE